MCSVDGLATATLHACSVPSAVPGRVSARFRLQPGFSHWAHDDQHGRHKHRELFRAWRIAVCWLRLWLCMFQQAAMLCPAYGCFAGLVLESLSPCKFACAGMLFLNGLRVTVACVQSERGVAGSFEGKTRTRRQGVGSGQPGLRACHAAVKGRGRGRLVNLRCICSLARGEPVAPLCGGCPGRVYSCMSVHAGGVFRHRTWLCCCVEGVNVASPTGSSVDLRA